jgi:hypothetical protein
MLDTWFAGLAGRLGLDAGLEEGGPPPPVRHLLGQIWVAAVDAGAQRAETALSNRHSELQADREALAKARQELVAQEAALAEKAIGIDQALALAKRQLDERNVEMNQLRSELGTLHADLTRLRGSLAGVVQERDADRQVFAEQQRAHASERQRIEERAAATERRLLEDIDRSRQDAKVARNALADSQRQQELMRGEVQTLTERNHPRAGRNCCPDGTAGGQQPTGVRLVTGAAGLEDRSEPACCTGKQSWSASGRTQGQGLGTLSWRPGINRRNRPGGRA